MSLTTFAKQKQDYMLRILTMVRLFFLSGSGLAAWMISNGRGEGVGGDYIRDLKSGDDQREGVQAVSRPARWKVVSSVVRL